jgi:hypothetical protein
MDTFLNSSKLKSTLNANNKQQLLASSKAVDQELAKHSRIIDMTRVNKTKIIRNEVIILLLLIIFKSFSLSSCVCVCLAQFTTCYLF